MFSPSCNYREPTDIVLVVEMSLPQISSWLARLAEDMPDRVPPHQDLDALKKDLAPLYDEMRAGDSLWLCQSIVMGPGHGHVGLALVRDGQPVVYIRVVGQ